MGLARRIWHPTPLPRAGVSIDNYVRMGRGHLASTSEQVLDSVADALQLDDAEREHLRAPCPGNSSAASRRTRQTPAIRCRLPAGMACVAPRDFRS